MFLQFELWKQCSVGCKFCYNRGIKFKRDKIKSMEFIIDKLQSDETDKYNRIGLIAGEIFNGELSTLEEKNLFYKLIDILIEKIHTNKIQEMLITSSMIYKNTNDILEFCEYLKNKNVIDKVMICTSYDTLGRFNKKTESIWHKDMKLVHMLYPKLMLHVEMILTQHFLESVISGEFNPKIFKELYGSTVNYLLPFTGYGKLYKTKMELESKLPGFFPKRNTFLEFLRFSYINEIFTKSDIYDLNNINLHSDTVYCTFYDQNFIKIDNRHTNEYLGYVNYTYNSGGYIDSEIHPRQDIEMFYNTLGE